VRYHPVQFTTPPIPAEPQILRWKLESGVAEHNAHAAENRRFMARM